MKKLFRMLPCVALFATALSAVCSCTPDDSASTSSKPTITSLTVDESTITESSASASVSFTSCDVIYYTCVAGKADDFSAGSAKFAVLEVAKGDKQKSLDFDDLASNTAYVVAVYGANSAMETGVTTVEFNTAAPALEDNGEPNIALALNADATAINVTVVSATSYSYQIYPADAKPEVGAEQWTSVGLNEETDYSISIEHLTDGEYVIEAYASLYDSEAESESQSDIVSLDFSYETPVDSYFTVADDVAITPATIAVAFDIDETYCEGVALTVVESSLYMLAGFTGEIASGLVNNIITSDSTFVANGGSFLKPNTEYTVGAVAVKKVGEYDNSWGETIPMYETRGKVWNKNFTTGKLALDSSDDAVLSIDEDMENTTSITFGAVIGQVTETAGYIFGYTKSSNIKSGVASWIKSSSWLEGDDCNIVAFADGETTVKVTAEGLTQDTEYTAFAIGVDAEGNLGRVVSEEISTTPIQSNENIEYNAIVTPAANQVTLEIEFGTDCDKIFYYNAAASSYITADDAEYLITANMSKGENMLSVDSAVDGVGTVVIAGLNELSKYTLYYMAVDKNNAISEMRSTAYTTPPATFDNAATVTLSLDKSSLNDSSNASVWLNVEMGDGAVKYIYPVQGVNEADWKITDPNNLEAYGKAALGEYFKKTSTAPKVEVTLLNEDCVAVFIPVDKYGKYGTPVVYRFDWNSL